LGATSLFDWPITFLFFFGNFGASLNIEIFIHSRTYIEVHTISLNIPPPIYRFQEDTILGKPYGTKWGASGNMHVEPIGNFRGGTDWEFEGLTLNTWATTKT
jgi:hypothetical protein